MLLGREGVNQTQIPLRLVGYTVDGTSYWIATSRFDLTAEQVAQIYKQKSTRLNSSHLRSSRMPSSA